ncbi:hypothetical protein DFJ58DRAFT_848602 [Suillus subalutaceus]|uniref:uncharacterized protein n=1 Tax=Suillus subalutaceus TaxID=48586 RepID=UPI001B87A6AF|nr:uncharacterized protein DFJ58DRAFT_848602 [Suillus subalutaceus]KAG1829739.1 hypothetical protein DFJ58DRAFT_848602 [Suillus subalutaceus]
MLCATSKPFSPMEFYGWENWQGLQMKTHRGVFYFPTALCAGTAQAPYFQELLKSVAGLEEQLMQGGDDELTKGASGARGDDTKSLKGVCSTGSPQGQSLILPLTCNMKIDCGCHHEWTGALLCPAGLDWSKPRAYKYVFTSPVLWIENQGPLVRQCPNSQNDKSYSAVRRIYCNADTVTDLERFYNSILDIFEDP